jgi:CBS domain containing-hemolysin-like protein
VVGELAPKSLAIRMPEVVGLWAALPLYAFYWAMYPFIYLLNASANMVLGLAGLPARAATTAITRRRTETDTAHQPAGRKIQPGRTQHPGPFAGLQRPVGVRPDAPD